MLRITIGASDFSLKHYTLDDMPAGQVDPDLQHFNIAVAERDVIPVLHDILAIQPGARIIASPWSAPAWMKTSANVIGGTLFEQYEATYASYLVRFVDAFRGEGIPIFALTVQNEPAFEPLTYPGMNLPADARARIIGKYLGPALAGRKPGTAILDWDHNWDEPDEPLSVLADPDARRYVAGVAWHCYRGDPSAQTTVHRAFPKKDVYLTECSGGDWPSARNGELLLFARNIIMVGITNRARGVVYWNLALDENHGPHAGGCDECKGVVTIDSATGSISRNDEYYAFAHFSRFVLPGAVRVRSGNTNAGIHEVAFQNLPDQGGHGGSVVLVAVNGNTTTNRLSVSKAPSASSTTCRPAAWRRSCGHPRRRVHQRRRQVQPVSIICGTQLGPAPDRSNLEAGGYPRSSRDKAGIEDDGPRQACPKESMKAAGAGPMLRAASGSGLELFSCLERTILASAETEERHEALGRCLGCAGCMQRRACENDHLAGTCRRACTIRLWPGTPPDARAMPGPDDASINPKSLIGGKPVIAVSNVSQPTMTVYAPTGKNTGAAVVVFPGGGFQILAMDLEGTDACDWLTSKGITSVLLKYRVPSAPYDWKCDCRPHNRELSVPSLQDAQRTMRLVRSRAAQWHIDPHKIGVLGFSAGGYLVAEISTNFDRHLYAPVDAADKESARPDFAMPIYPGHLATDDDTFNANVRVSRETPPTFLVQAEDDYVDGVNQYAGVLHRLEERQGAGGDALVCPRRARIRASPDRESDHALAGSGRDMADYHRDGSRGEPK